MIRSKKPLQLYLVRHVEAYKNLSDIHGGGDQRLTPSGIKQAVRIGNFLRQHGNFELNTGVVIHQPEGRSTETARIIGKVAAARIRLEPTFKGVTMGIIAGLPEKEVEALYPDVAAGIRAWRANPGAMAHPVVPGSESNTSFADRIRAGLKRSITRAQGLHQSIAVVVTSSTLTMLNHLLVNDGKLREGAYAFTDPPLGSVAAWCLSADAPVQTLPTTVPK